MDVNNVSFKGTADYNNYYQYYQPEINEQVQQTQEDKQKSNAAKYMIGATALAGVVSLFCAATCTIIKKKED